MMDGAAAEDAIALVDAQAAQWAEVAEAALPGAVVFVAIEEAALVAPLVAAGVVAAQPWHGCGPGVLRSSAEGLPS